MEEYVDSFKSKCTYTIESTTLLIGLAESREPKAAVWAVYEKGPDFHNEAKKCLRAFRCKLPVVLRDLKRDCLSLAKRQPCSHEVSAVVYGAKNGKGNVTQPRAMSKTCLLTLQFNGWKDGASSPHRIVDATNPFLQLREDPLFSLS